MTQFNVQRRQPLASRGYLEKLAHVLMKKHHHGYDGKYDPKNKEPKRRIGDQ
jgi:hypothetical protein